MEIEFSDDSKNISFSVVDYEFPQGEDEYDKNWLIIEISSGNIGGKKIKRCPAMLTWELVELHGFFIGNNQKRCVDFMEPELEFHYDSKEICLSLRYGMRIDESTEVNTFRQLRAETWKSTATKTLSDLCKKFPVKGSMPF